MQLIHTLSLSFTKFVSAQCVRKTSSRTTNLDGKIFHLTRFIYIVTRLVAHQIPQIKAQIKSQILCSNYSMLLQEKRPGINSTNTICALICALICGICGRKKTGFLERPQYIESYLTLRPFHLYVAKGTASPTKVMYNQ